MASVASTPSAVDEIRFAPDFVSNVSTYERAIRRHRVMSWARQRSLGEDLVQQALLDLSRVDARYDSTRASSPHHFRVAVLHSRVSDSARVLRRMHGEVAAAAGDTELDFDPTGGGTDNPDFETEQPGSDPVMAEAERAQVWRAVTAAIAELPGRQREVIELALDDCSDKDIAAHLGITAQAVNKSRLAAIANLRRALVPAN